MLESDIRKLKVGQRLHHELFGAGTMTMLKPNPDIGASIRIKFDDHGEKELQTSFSACRLHKIPKAKKAKA